MSAEPVDQSSLEIQKLHAEINALKTKLRMTKSDRDMISKYTAQLNRDMTSLQDKHNEVTQERDYYVSQLRDVKNSYTAELFRMEQESKRLSDSYHVKCESYKDLILEYESLKSEHRHLNFELDVLQVDYHNEKEAHQRANNQLTGLRRKHRNLQTELDDADRSNTKRHQRLVDRLESVEVERDRCSKLLATYETELERLGSLCFVCREGVKSVKCGTCVQRYCEKCSTTMEFCPFCRAKIENEDEDYSSDEEELDEEELDEEIDEENVEEVI